jgi:hypothetical protein
MNAEVSVFTDNMSWCVPWFIDRTEEMGCVQVTWRRTRRDGAHERVWCTCVTIRLPSWTQYPSPTDVLMDRLDLVALHPVAVICGVSTVNETRQTELMFWNTSVCSCAVFYLCSCLWLFSNIWNSTRMTITSVTYTIHQTTPSSNRMSTRCVVMTESNMECE